MGAIIKAFGHFIPDKRLNNKELSERFSINEKWIEERTGITERRYCEEGATSDMIVKAVHLCLQHTEVSNTDIDCVIVATMSPDFHTPSTAAIVHKKLGTCNAAGFDIYAACSGYIYGLQLATALINSKCYKNILVCGGEKFSSIIDPTDRKTTLVFADGAGCSLVSHSAHKNDIIDTFCMLDSTCLEDITMKAGGSHLPATEDNIKEGLHYLRFNSKEIGINGVALMERAVREIMAKNDIGFSDIDFIVPHQANKRMVETLASTLNLPMDKFIINIETIGNTGAGSIPVAISQTLQNKTLFKGGEKLLLVAVGAGYTYSSAIIQV